jgi:diguanylate cyclase (GGDEF)-like protein
MARRDAIGPETGYAGMRRGAARWVRRTDRHAVGPVRPPEHSTLRAEIARLEAELSAARVHIAALEESAETDPLTGVLNRRGFERVLNSALAHVRRYGGSAALIYLDLDGFKPINDRHGHAAGDAVLRSVAGALRRHVRGSDTVARLGGDEFSVILWNLDAPAALAKAHALEMALLADAVIPWGAARLGVGASVGVAMIDSASSAAVVVAQADHAMYERKTARREI